MLKNLLSFTLLLFLVAGLSYGIHSWVLTRFFEEQPVGIINLAYKFNVGITLLFTTSIIAASEQLKEQLGFIFLAGGFVKLGVFLFIIKTSEYTIDKSVFLHFFIPYVVCVVFEIIWVIRILNAANFEKDR